MKNKFFITTPIYYANAKPHIGHAYTTIVADALTRFYRLQNRKVFFLTGMDEHGVKIQKKAEEEKKNPREFVDEISGGFKKLWKELDIEYDGFIRTTDKNHKEVVQKVLQNLFEKGAICKGKYEGLYCAGCEQFKNKSDLIDGKCPDHGTMPEIIKEESYLLKMSEKQNELIEKIKSDEFKIAPEKYKNEILSFLENNKLKDISISRKNISWGIPLPFDSEHTTYVWVDAFLNYLTGVGWNGSLPLEKGELGRDLKNNAVDESNILQSKKSFKSPWPPFLKGENLGFWPPDIQLIGKDILRVHATIWPIMLLYLGIELPKKLFVHGHILSGGKKMSKTMENVIGIDEMIEKFGVDGTRYLLLSAGTFGEDVDMTMERMAEKYNADLANGLGNLISRVVKLMEHGTWNMKHKTRNNEQFSKEIDKLELDKALNYVWNIVREDNKYIEDAKPWELAKDESKKEEFGKVIQKLVDDLSLIAELLKPFMPETAEKIKKALRIERLNEVLFKRIR